MDLEAKPPTRAWSWLGPAICRAHGRLLAFVVCLIMIGGVEAQAQLASVAVAKNAVGVLLVTRSDGRTERLQGKGVLPLFEGDELKTGAGAQALIQFSDGTQLALNEETTMTIRPRRQEDKGMIRILKLLLGEIWVRTSQAPPPLEVETPVTTAAIRGTEFNLKVFPDGRSELTVVQGEVDFGMPLRRLPEYRGITGPRPEVMCPVRAGTASMAGGSAACSPPVSVDVKRVTGWINKVVE
jgi:ferric-dicitrate binding protein FerR (iron transport regulator)